MNFPKLDFIEDVCFKVLWEQNPDVLIRMLNAFSPLTAHARVVSVTIQNPSLYPEDFDSDEESQEKLFIVDLLVRILITMPDGRELEEMATCEMQNYIEDFFFVRLLIYWARAYSKTVKKGEPYSVAQTVYVLAFTPRVFPQVKAMTTIICTGLPMLKLMLCTHLI